MGNNLGLGSLNIKMGLLPLGLNHWEDKAGNFAVVNHIMQGTMASTEGWFNNPKAEVSSNFGVSKAGDIVCWVHPDKSAWANGWVEVPSLVGLPWLAEHPQVNPNKLTVSIEHEGNSGEGMSEDQIVASIALNLALAKKYFIQPSRFYFVGHYQISPKSRPNCPGDKFPWNRLMAELQGQPIMPPVEPPRGPEFQDPLTGYWVIEPLATYYASQGGLAEFGRPIGPMTSADKNYPGQTIQWFERDRLEVHSDGNIYRGLIGVEAFRSLYGQMPEYFPK